MNLFSLSWKNLAAKPLSTALSLILLMLGVSIISLLLLLDKQLQNTFDKNVRGIDMVVGAKGSPLQLILASVYHIDAPTGNIPLKEANMLVRNPLVETAIPLAYGDNFKGYRILGTDTSYVHHYEGKLAEGEPWDKDFEVNIGSLVASRLGLAVGSSFYGSHGVSGEMADVHDENAYIVKGIFEPSGTVLDQMILTNVSSVWSIHDHEGEDHEEEDSDHEAEGEDHEGEGSDHEAEEEEKEITALLLKFRSPLGNVTLPRIINENTSMQAALPAIEVNRLIGLLGIGIETLRALAIAIIVISGISVFISLFNSLKDRKYELALMRTMGASRGRLFIMIILEGLMLAILGFILGYVLSRIGMMVMQNFVATTYKYEFTSVAFLPEEWLLLGVTLLIGLLAAIIPAFQAYNTDISETLADA
ncbi:MAG: FtsX-like permease family protein [Bacteroidota bacterium]